MIAISIGKEEKLFLFFSNYIIECPEIQKDLSRKQQLELIRNFQVVIYKN